MFPPKLPGALMFTRGCTVGLDGGEEPERGIHTVEGRVGGPTHVRKEAVLSFRKERG